MSRKEDAMNFFEQGYNCSQALVLAFANLTDCDRDTLAKAALMLGGGVSRLRDVCGAVSGMGIVLGLLTGQSEPCTKDEKAGHYEKMQSLAFKFKENNGSYICRELLGLDIDGADSPVPQERTEQFYKERPCRRLIGDAAEILEEYLDSLKG